MGNNAAFSNFEAVVHACYKHGVLGRPLLNDIIKAFKGQDADSGGYCGMLTHGKDLEAIVFEVYGETAPEKPSGPTEWKKQTEQQQKAWDAYHEARGELFNRLVDLD
mgnify:CR=1